MRHKTWMLPVEMGLLLLMTLGLVSCSVKPQPRTGRTEQGNLQDAMKIRTEITVLQKDLADTVLSQITSERKGARTIHLFRKIIARAESKQEGGNILLTKDRYSDAVESYKEAERLYRQVLDWREVQKKMNKVERDVATARMLAESSAKPGQLTEPKRLQSNAEGYLESGEIDQAMAEFEKARKSFEALIPSEEPATLEQVIATRTAMFTARVQIKDPRHGSVDDLLSRAQNAETAAIEALEERQYTPARALFVAAEKLYREASVLQVKRKVLETSRKGVEDNMKLADNAFKDAARLASFERGKQALADADKALADDDFETAQHLLTNAAEYFTTIRSEAEQLQALIDAQQSWSDALATADENLLSKHVANQWQTARANAADAQVKATAGQTAIATDLFKQSTNALNTAVAEARAKENDVQTALMITRLETAISNRDKFGSEDILTELERLIPTDPRMVALRDKVTAVPGHKKYLTINLGDGVNMEFVIIRPGSFMMGSDKGADDEKPVHKVTITKPFYIGKYEVTQEQWHAVMDSHPSSFEGMKNPVENVNWNDCQTFLTKLKKKVPGKAFNLPTEAQWEYACRAGSTTEYCYGDDVNRLGEYAWYSSNSGDTTHPVGEKKTNAWGLYDMHGNVWKWCRDWYGSYASGEVTDPTGAQTGNERVLRGGSWGANASYCRAASRYKVSSDYRNIKLGFRVSMDLP